MTLLEKAQIVKDTINLAINYLDGQQADSVTILFDEWKPNEFYKVGYKRQYNNLLYSCVQEHTSQIGWEPPITPALWKRTFISEWPEWIQPTGAQDAYNTGDKVSHNTHHWTSLVDANVWEPGVYGWQQESLS